MNKLSLADRLLGRQQIVVGCTVTIEHTNESLEAHVELDGIEPESGDKVRVLDAPTDIRFGDRFVCERQAVVVRGGPLDSLWARLSAAAEFPELYDLSFTGRRQL